MAIRWSRALLIAGMASTPLSADDFRPLTATYLGGPGVCEEWNAVDIAPDGTIVVAGRLPDCELGQAPVDLLAGGPGAVVRLAHDGAKVLSVSRIGDYVDDLEVGPDGRIAVAGSFGVAVLSPDASSVVWRDGGTVRGTKAAQFRNQTPPFRLDRYTRRVSRVAIGADGTVASIQAEQKAHGEDLKMGHLYVWDKHGTRLCHVDLTRYKYLKDVCVSGRHKLVIIGGFNTYKHDSPHMKDHPIHMPFMTAYAYDGRVKWADYDFPAKDTYAQNTYADSRVQRLAIGRDGYLYMGGYIHGGDYVWRHDPHDVTRRVDVDTGHDAFSSAYNMGRGIDMSYFARYDPADGRILAGQALLCRQNENGSGKPTQIQIRGIQADEQGSVYLAGYCEGFIRNRSEQKVAGKPVGGYYKPEPFLMVVSPDLKTRRVWTVLADHGEAAAWGLGFRGGMAALVGEVYEGTMLTTEGALQTAPSVPTDGYLVVWETGAKPAE